MQSSSSCVFSAVNLLPEMSLENLGDIRDAVVYSLAYGSGSSIKEGYTRIIVQQVYICANVFIQQSSLNRVCCSGFIVFTATIVSIATNREP
jgi:hypothetical protein